MWNNDGLQFVKILIQSYWWRTLYFCRNYHDKLLTDETIQYNQRNTTRPVMFESNMKHNNAHMN